MRILKTAELEMKAIFIGWKLATTTFLSFDDIRTTAGPLDVYLQNLKSLRSLRNLPAFEAEGFEAFEICRFSGRCPKEYVFDVCEVYEKQKRQKNVPKEYTYKCNIVMIIPEPNSENCLDLIFVASPCDKVIIETRKKLQNFCNQKFHDGYVKS